MTSPKLPALLLPGLLLMAPYCPGEDDVLLRAMHDELERSRALKVPNMQPPYFIEYGVEDADILSISASLGALVNLNHMTLRVPSVRVRVGSPAFDNTNHVYSDFYTGSRYDPEQLPLDNDYGAIRQVFWLATDRAFKTAQEAIGRKQSALRNVNQPEKLPDFSSAPPVQAVQAVHRTLADEAAWKARAVKLSGLFAAYPAVLSSSLEFQSIQASTYLLNSEGTAIRTPENLTFLRVRAAAQAPDGMTVKDAEVFQSIELKDFTPELELSRGITAMAQDLTALAKAPVGEGYDGPVLFEPKASAQLFAQVLGDQLKLTRKPVGEPGRQTPYLPSELAGKTGSRILPEWMDVVDDPSQTEWHGQRLFGHYDFDVEGTRPAPVQAIQKGVLKSFLLTRTPAMKGFENTNGHARMHGSFGASAPGFGTLFVRASRTVSMAELKKKLIDQIQQRNKPYGLLVRKLDYPSSMSLEEFRHASTAMAQSGGGGRAVALPLLVYRVYPDGREELIRGVRFRGLGTRSFKDIGAATDETYVFNFLDSRIPLALMGAGSFVVNASVVAPGVLFDDLELERIQEDLPKLPIVPPPTLGP